MFFFCLSPSSCFLPIILLYKKIHEACLDILQGKVVSLRRPFEAVTHDISIFHGGEKEVSKEQWDRNVLHFKIKEGERIVGDSGYTGEPSRIVVWRDEHTQKYKKSWQELAVVRRLLFKGSRTGEFSSTILPMEGALKRGRKCIRDGS
jgi:hypothetical protein